MDEYVKLLLRKWELPELIPTFNEEEVNEKAFKCLTDEIIRELVPKLGKRAIFSKAYKAYREALDEQSDTSVVVNPNEPVPLPEHNTVPVMEIKLETAVLNLLENDTSTFESQSTLEENFKLEVPCEVASEDFTGSTHHEQQAAPASSVNNECVDTPNTRGLDFVTQDTEHSPIETKSNYEIPSGDYNVSVKVQNFSDTIQDKTAMDNANIVTETTNVHYLKKDTIIENKESNHEVIYKVMATSVDDVDSSNSLQTIEKAFDTVELTMSEVQHDERASAGTPITVVSVSQNITEELDHHESDDQIEDSIIDDPSNVQELRDCESASPALDQCIDSSQPSHITFSISELSDPSETDLKIAGSLQELLSASETLSHLLKKPFLTRSKRNALAEEIVGHLCASNDGVLGNEVLSQWARAVELVFTQEVNQLYFRESDDGYSCGGKLVQCYQRRKQLSEDTVDRESG